MLRNKLIPVNFMHPVVGIDLHSKTEFLSNRHWVIAEVLKYDLTTARFFNHDDELVGEWPCTEIEYISIPVLDSDSPVVIAQKSSDYLAAVKVQRPNAWSRWSPEEDEQLAQHFARGLNYDEIADIHQRTPVAIYERLRKIGIDPDVHPELGTRPEKRHLENHKPWEGRIPEPNTVVTVCLGCSYEIVRRPCQCWSSNDTSKILTWREHQWIYSLYGKKIRKREF